MKKTRDISILEYFNILQVEYLLYEVRSKIYPRKKDKERFKQILGFKKEKIENIAEKNDLKTMFDCEDKLKEIEEKFYDDNGVPKNMSNKDKYFYYLIGSNFSYQGDGVKLLQYNFHENMATVEKDDQELEVNLNEIKRIF